jgi:hypothetical protein
MTELKDLTWARGSTASSRKRGKLHLVEAGLHGGRRAVCRRTLVLRPEVYPSSMFDAALDFGDVCKACLEVARDRLEWFNVEERDDD